jgi:catechol 2,3-dioxygenase-like lactoylglutathione lyase family enzyme
MTIVRMDNVAIVVEDLDAAIAFFLELGMELEGRMAMDGPWGGQTVGIPGALTDIAMLRSPDGHGGIELTRYRSPGPLRPTPYPSPPNTLGFHRVMFAVDDIDDTIRRLTALGGELVGEVVNYEDVYRLCYLRAPEGFVIALAEQLSGAG